MAALGVGFVVVAPDCGEDAAVAEVPLLDLVVVALDVRPELLEVGAQPVLDDVEPGALRIAIRVDARANEEVVVDLLQPERVEERLRFRPVRRLARLEGDELDVEPFLVGARECRRGLGGVVLAGIGVLELVLGERRRVLLLAVVALGSQLEIRLAQLVVGEPLVGDLPACGRAVLDGAERVADARCASAR